MVFLLPLAFQVFQEPDDFFILFNESEVGLHDKPLSRGDLLQEEFLSVAGHLPGIGQLFHGLKELPGEKDDGTLSPPNSFAR